MNVFQYQFVHHINWMKMGTAIHESKWLITNTLNTNLFVAQQPFQDYLLD